MIKSNSGSWFEVKIRYEKTMENGLRKRVTEAYAIDALSFTEAEARITEQMAPYIGGESCIQDISRAAYNEVITSDKAVEGRFYKLKVACTTIDPNSGKAKRTNTCYLVQADDIDKAKGYIDELLQACLFDYEVVSVVETKLIDVFVYGSRSEKKPAKDNTGNPGKAVNKSVENVPDGTKGTISSGNQKAVGNQKAAIDKRKKGNYKDDD